MSKAFTMYKSPSGNGGYMLTPVSQVQAAAEHGNNVAVLHGDGSVSITYAIGTRTTRYTPVTKSEADAIMDANGARLLAAQVLLEPVRAALRAAEGVQDGVHMLEGPGARTGVVAFIGSARVNVIWWHATFEEQLAAERPGQDPWADGGARGAVRPVLEAFAREYGAVLAENRGNFTITPA
ncbi:hypothetical protein [Kitasatospora sp. NPDC087315]|uniref:hypothetical protein n=1 Tax=Kitasatospora sp. NPDC087315 TaxID=3364069 RepID=UPI00381086CA